MKLSIFALVAMTGCASLDKKEYFAEYGPDGSARYYRVTVDGYASGKLDYRSGWYDAKAVDDLFGSVSNAHDADVATARRKKKAIERTFDRYMEALETGASDQVAERRQVYEAALKTATGVTNAGETPISTLDRAGKKFVMVMANDPSQILDAISQRVQTQTITDSVARILSRNASAKYLTNESRLTLLRLQLTQLDAALEAATGQAEKAADADSLRNDLTALRAEVEALR